MSTTSLFSSLERVTVLLMLCLDVTSGGSLAQCPSHEKKLLSVLLPLLLVDGAEKPGRSRIPSEEGEEGKLKRERMGKEIVLQPSKNKATLAIGRASSARREEKRKV